MRSVKWVFEKITNQYSRIFAFLVENVSYGNKFYCGTGGHILNRFYQKLTVVSGESVRREWESRSVNRSSIFLVLPLDNMVVSRLNQCQWSRFTSRWTLVTLKISHRLLPFKYRCSSDPLLKMYNVSMKEYVHSVYSSEKRCMFRDNLMETDEDGGRKKTYQYEFFCEFLNFHFLQILFHNQERDN